MIQDDLFNPIAGEALKQEAIERVRENADEDWRSVAMQTVASVASRNREFTTDDVWAALGMEVAVLTHEPRAMGAVMTDAARCGLCRKSDRVVPSVRKCSHRRPIAVWISNVFGGKV